MSANTRPGSPSNRKAARQPLRCAASPATVDPSHAPRQAPNAKTVKASGRRAGGNLSAKIEVDGAVPPASPTPTPKRPNMSCVKLRARPHSAVIPDQMSNAQARMLRRLARSAYTASGMPTVT